MWVMEANVKKEILLVLFSILEEFLSKALDESDVSTNLVYGIVFLSVRERERIDKVRADVLFTNYTRPKWLVALRIYRNNVL